MKTEYDDKQEMFNFELMICWKRLELWKNEALNLFYSARVLYEFETQKSSEIFGDTKILPSFFSSDIASRSYFNYRTQRMLWAYGFENIFKGVILAKIKQSDDSITEVPLKKIQGHSLLKLANSASFELTGNETFYLGVLEKCSVWAGRYPLPLSSNGMYERRKPMKSSEELNLRTSQRLKDYHEGKIPRIFCESDVIHSAVGLEEYGTYIILKDKLINELDKFNTE